MHKRILAIVSMLCAVPLIASAWTLNTWVRSQGGNVKVGNYAKSTVLTGSTFKSYTSTNGYNAVITADANYFINNLIIDGVPTTPTSSTSTTIAVPSGASSIWVDFLRNQLSFNVVAGANGIVTPSGAQPNVYAGATYRVFSFIPAKGQSVTAVTADVPANIIFSTTALNQVNKKVIVTVSKVTGNVTLTGTFSGSVSTGFGNYSGSTTGTLYKAGAACDACHIAQGLDKAGAILSNWSGSAHKTNNIVCAVCHQGASTGAHPGQVLDCSFCHTKDALAQTKVHTVANSGDCSVCHVMNPHAATKSAVANSVDAEHISGSATQAEYVVPTANCADCHSNGGNTPSSTLLHDFAESGHGKVTSPAWWDYDFKNKNNYGDVSCQRCHTSTGFVNFQTSGYHQPTSLWGNPADTTRQALSCVACHSNSDDFAGSVRNAGAYVAPYGTYSSAASFSYVQYPDVTTSNVCIPCHAGQMNESFAQKADATNTNMGAVAPHYLAAAAILNGKSGFKFYTSSTKYFQSYGVNGSHFAHDQIGVNNYKFPLGHTTATGNDGPCVTCHMSSGSHTLDYKVALNDTTNGVCAKCHVPADGHTLTETVVEEEKTGYNAALDLFKAVLTSKNIYVNMAAYPYFFKDSTSTAAANWLKDWTATGVGPTTGATGTQNLGVAFNYNLLFHETGAYTHNRSYAKRLMYDSLEYLDKGTVNGTLNFTNFSSATTPVSAARTYIGATRP